MKHGNGKDQPICIRWSFAFLIILVVLLASARSVDAQSGAITNVYDETGRLIAVVDPAGDTARYNYDATGNLLSISRHSSSVISIINFTPNSGPTGTSVTIHGTAFSSTPSQNTVTFNGVAATIVSSTATQIVTSVPAGATTGAISVTSPAGSLSSATAFTVTTPDAPTITNFTPTIGTSGTSVTISGTNFNAIPSKNTTKFNATYALVSSSTATSVSTGVPSGGGSGKITIATPNGSAVTADDFFIPPSPYTPTDVMVTGRMISGENRSVSLTSASKVGMILFDGVAGQRAGIKITSSSITSTNLSIYNPKGVSIGTATVGPSGGFVDAAVFTMSGTYTILVDPNSTYTGNISFTLYLSNDVTNTIAPTGSAVTISTTTPGQNATLSFSALANQRVYLKISGVSMSGGTNNWVNVSIKKLDGTSLASETVSSSGGFIDTQTLPMAGTYRVFVDPTNASTGSATLTLYDVLADIVGTIATDGSSTSTSTSLGQNAKFTFNGTANQRVYLKISNVSVSGGNPNWVNISIKKPDGTNLATTTVSSGTGHIDTQSLPVAGVYTVLVDPQNTCATSNVTLALYDVPADITGTITPGGSSVTVTTTTPGQNGSLTFSGTANQRVSLNITGVSITGNSWVTIVIKKPDGSNLTSTTVDSNGGFIDVKTLATSGTYTVFVDPLTSNTGSVTLTLYDVPDDATASTTINASAVGVTTTVAGQNANVTFSGTSGQQVTVRITNNTMGSVTVKLLKPDGNQLTSSTSSSSSFNLTTQTLPTTGTYKITIDPSGTNIGSISVAVTNP